MKKTIASFVLLLIINLTSVTSNALGIITHEYIADTIASQVQQSHPKLYKILKQYRNDYWAGAGFPDTGYIKGAHYGEDTHWPPFVRAFSNYINSNYPRETEHRNHLIAFLLGITTHNKSDITSHWTYYNWVAKYDFSHLPAHEAWEAAHHTMDIACDFYVISQKHWYKSLSEWRIPLSDLLSLYQQMALNVPEGEIISANIAYYVARRLPENLIAYPGYYYMRYIKAPWGMSHYETRATGSKRYGGLNDEIADAKTYLLKTWAELDSRKILPPLEQTKTRIHPHLSPLTKFATSASNQGWVEIKPYYNQDGSLSITPKMIIKYWRYHFEQLNFIKKMKALFSQK